MECTTDQWKKDWLRANCVFVNLEHRLYLPPPITLEMFQPQPRWAKPDYDQVMTLLPPSPTNIAGPSTGVVINSQTIYLEDIDPLCNSVGNRR